MAGSGEELKSLLKKVKDESEKVGLKLNIHKTKVMTSGPFNSWKIYRETVETVTDFILGGFKITADGDYSHEIKRRLLIGRKVMTNLDRILKNRDITLPTKVHLVKAIVFPVVMYECEIWTIKKAEGQRIDAFELWFGEDSWESFGQQGDPTSPSSRKSVLNIHWKDWYWSWSFNTVAIWFKELAHLKRLWCWERLKVGEEGDDKWWDGWMTSLTQWTWVWVNSGCWWWTWKPGVLQSMGWQRVRCDWETELNWTWCLRGVPTDTNGKEPLPANAGDLIYGVLSLGQENPLEEEIATHSSILAWRIPWTEEPGRLQSKRTQRDMTEQSIDTHDRYCGNKTQ